MSDSNVADRLKTFIERKGLTYSQFADTCGIPRPSLSQLLTGRNKKISDIMVGQIHNMFPELSIVWLLFGEGPMETGAPSQPVNGGRQQEIFEEGLFAQENRPKQESKKIVFSADGRQTPEISKGESLKNYAELAQSADLKIEKLQNKIKELQSQIDIFKKNPRKVSHITVYYDDSTFETFFPR